MLFCFVFFFFPMSENTWAKRVPWMYIIQWLYLLLPPWTESWCLTHLMIRPATPLSQSLFAGISGPPDLTEQPLGSLSARRTQIPRGCRWLLPRNSVCVTQKIVHLRFHLCVPWSSLKMTKGSNNRWKRYLPRHHLNKKLHYSGRKLNGHVGRHAFR